MELIENRIAFLHKSIVSLQYFQVITRESLLIHEQTSGKIPWLGKCYLYDQPRLVKFCGHSCKLVVLFFFHLCEC